MKKAVKKIYRFAADIADYFYYGWKSNLFPLYIKSFASHLTFNLNIFRHNLYTKRNHVKHLDEEKVKKLKKTVEGLHALLPTDKRFSYSILVPVHRPNPTFFKKTLASLLDQTASHVEILIGYQGQQSELVYQLVERLKRQATTSIKTFQFPKEEDDQEFAFNRLAKEATGDYLLLMGQEDWIRPDFLFRYEQTMRTLNHPLREVVYCNENQINEWDYTIPTTEIHKKAIQFPYFFDAVTGHGLLVPRALWNQAGGLRYSYKGAHYEDLFLRLEMANACFQCIPICLYSKRSVKGTKEQEPSKERLLQALTDYTNRKGLDWKWEAGYDGQARAIPALNSSSSVQIVIPFKDQKELTLNCVAHVLKQKGVDYKITAIDNGSQDASIGQELRQLGVEVLTITEPFNYSRLNNLAVKETRTAQSCDLVLCLNNDVDLEEGALMEMARWIDQPGIGMVGCRLYYPDGRLQHGGVSLDYYRLPTQMHWEHIEKFATFDAMDRAKKLGVAHAVTAACALIKRQTFLDIGGFDEVWYPIAYSDTNLAVKLALKGLSCFYTPYAAGMHHESASRKEGIEDFENSRWLHQLILKTHYRLPSNFFH